MSSGFHSSGVGTGQLELDGHWLRRRPHFGDVGVDAGGEGFDAGAGVGGVGVPFGLHVAAIEEEARRPVLLDIGGAEGFREQAKAALAPEVDLPEAVARGVVALQEEGVAL